MRQYNRGFEKKMKRMLINEYYEECEEESREYSIVIKIERVLEEMKGDYDFLEDIKEDLEDNFYPGESDLNC